ncbi:Arp2/3 complex 21 kDa subunit ARPC3, partial [Caulochytrium protostelioides]
MPAYHSAFNAPGGRMAGNMGIIPIKSKIRGPAPPAPEDQEDVIDEAIDFFRANCLFRNFEIKGPGDRTLIYLTLFIQEC